LTLHSVVSVSDVLRYVILHLLKTFFSERINCRLLQAKYFSWLLIVNFR